MENQLGLNLKLLRKKLGLNQSEVATVAGKGDTTIGNWEKGITEPNTSELSKLSQLFGVSIDDLIKSDLSISDLTKKQKDVKYTVNSDLNSDRNSDLKGRKKGDYLNLNPVKNVINEPENSYIKQKLPVVVTVYPGGDENIIFVPVKAQAGYLIGYGDPSFIEKLPSFQMPGLRNGTYRMFEAQGLSMAPTISDKDKVIAQWVPSIAEIRENRIHVIVLRTGVLIKRVLNRSTERGIIYLKSDTLTHRQDHPIIEVDPAEILEIWYVRMKVSGDLSEPSELYNRMSELEINMHEIMKKMGLKKP